MLPLRETASLENPETTRLSQPYQVRSHHRPGNSGLRGFIAFDCDLTMTTNALGIIVVGNAKDCSWVALTTIVHKAITELIPKPYRFGNPSPKLLNNTPRAFR